MKKFLCILLSMVMAALVFVSCTQENIYLPDPDTWRAGDKTFNSFSDAVNYLASYTPKGMVENTIFLLRDVSGNEYGEPIVIPKIYPADRDISIDLGNQEYRFDGSKDGYLVKEGGKTLDITNGFFVLTQNSGSAAVFKTEQGALVLAGSLTVRDGRPNPVLLDATDSDVEFSSGHFTGDIGINNSCIEITGGTVDSRSVKAEGSETAPTSVIISGGHFETAALELGTFTTFDVSGDNSVVFVRNTTMRSGSETQIRGGDMTFGNDIAKNPEAVFEITGGTVSNPHRIDSLVLEAITEGGSPEDVTHTLIHEPELHKGKNPTCTDDGYESYYECVICEELFKDEKCLYPIDAPVVIPALGHDIIDEWHFSEYTHYHNCSRCNGIFDEGEHVFSEIVDDKIHCLVCGFEVDMEDHHHIYPSGDHKSDWQFDSEGHWLQCVCGEKTGYEEHDMSEWHICEDHLHMVRECYVCNYSEEVPEPESNIINIGIGTVEVPAGPPKACGVMDVTVEGNVFTVTFIPTDISPTDYITICQYKTENGSYRNAEQQESGSYVFVCDETCTIRMQIATNGGTILRSRTVSPQF